jgi:FKBP-type peptidyl-prolyl cis-trans isomerase
MKKSIFLFLSAGFALATMAQPGKTPAKTPTKTVGTPAILKNLTDSASYAIGVNVANFYKTQGITTVNAALVTRAITDIMEGKKPLLDDATANNCMNTLMTNIQAKKSQPRIDSGNNFLAKNKLRKEVKTTASGLQYEVLREGNGAKPTTKDSVTVHYKGTLLNGTPFDNSYDRGTPITFPLSGVIPGWTEGLQLMTVGSHYKFYIPSNLAYGAYDYGPIPGGSMLTFEVELLAVKPVKE